MSNDFLSKYSAKSTESHKGQDKTEQKRKKEQPNNNEVAGNNLSEESIITAGLETEFDGGHNQQMDDMLYEEKSTFKKYENVEPEIQVQKKVPTYFFITAGAIILALLAIILFMSLGGSKKVPDMQGWKESDVTLWATENKVMLRYSDEYSEKLAVDCVVSQSPEAGEEVGKGEFLELTLSLGPDPSVLVKIPNFETMNRSEVEKWASENYMSKVRIVAQNSQTIASGKLITSKIGDGTQVGKEIRRDTAVYLTFSSGTGEDGLIVVPDFSVMMKEQAESFAKDNEIELKIEEVFDKTIEKGVVMSQSIAAEEKIKKGDTIELKVSKGPEIKVPNFAKYDQEMAATIAGKEGISITMKEKYSGVAKGKLVSQSLKAGSLYDVDDILTLTYSLGNEIILGSYVGGSLDELKSMLKEYNDKGASLKTSVTYTASDKPAGTILTQTPSNTGVSVSKTIQLVVSEGAVVYTPDLVANEGLGYAEVMTREKVIAVCDSLGIVPVFNEEKKAGRLEGEVWSQSIQPGSEIQQGSVIHLKYVPVTSTITVPNLIGMTRAEIEARGIHKQLAIEYTMLDESGICQVQSIPAGEVVEVGKPIILSDNLQSGEGDEIEPEDQAVVE